jgi:uncharacterized protein YqeY
MVSLKETLAAARITSLKAHTSPRTQVLSSILAAVKQVEVDTRTSVDDTGVLTILNKMVKQRLDSISQFNAAGRTDLSKVEEYELVIIKEFLPQQATAAEITAILDKAMAEVGSATVKDMGRIMGLVKPQLHGKADMSEVSKLIKARLG